MSFVIRGSSFYRVRYIGVALYCCLLRCTRWFKLLSLWKRSSSVTIQMKAIEQYSCGTVYYVIQRGKAVEKR